MTLAPLLRRINAEPDAAMLLAALGLTERTVAPRMVVANCARPSRAEYVRGCHCPGCRAENTRYQAWWRRTRRIVTGRRTLFVELPGGQIALRIGGER